MIIEEENHHREIPMNLWRILDEQVWRKNKVEKCCWRVLEEDKHWTRTLPLCVRTHFVSTHLLCPHKFVRTYVCLCPHIIYCKHLLGNINASSIMGGHFSTLLNFQAHKDITPISEVLGFICVCLCSLIPHARFWQP